MSTPSRRKRQSRNGSAPKRIASEPKHYDVLRWRVRHQPTWTPEELADSLSNESLPWDETQPRWAAAVTAFRHLRSDQRVSVCRTFLAAHSDVRVSVEMDPNPAFAAEHGPRPIPASITEQAERNVAWRARRASLRKSINREVRAALYGLGALDCADVLDAAAQELRQQHERAKRGAR